MWTTILRGALAGAAATWAMTRVTTFLYERQPERATEREREARGGETAYVTAARKAGELVGRELSEEGRQKAGTALHWSLGLDAGITYAFLRPHLPGPRALRALGFGVAYFALMDEVAVPALRLTPGPGAFPWQTHARGLAGHLAFGLAAEAALQALGESDLRANGRALRIEV